MKKRITSALFILIIALPIIYLGKIPFYLFSLLIALLGYWELLNLIIKNKFYKIYCSILYLLLLVPSIFNNTFENIIDYKILPIIIILFCLLSLFDHKKKDFNINECFYLIGITLFLSLAFSALIITRNMSLVYFLYLISITILTDVFAQTVGIICGKHKINEISPNKTWEGSLGGAVFGTIFSSLFYYILINSSNIFLVLLITLFLSIISQFGDLLFSYIKRYYKIKDYSNLIPGHGGILDRLDSLIFASLTFIYFIPYL